MFHQAKDISSLASGVPRHRVGESGSIGAVDLPGNFNLNRAILLIVAWFWLGKTRISLVLV
jgi:hypothetical protein